MTDKKQERIAKSALGIFLDAWCSVDGKDKDSTDNNCHYCEFENGDMCLAKTFCNIEHFLDSYPQGCITREVSDV